MNIADTARPGVRCAAATPLHRPRGETKIGRRCYAADIAAVARSASPLKGDLAVGFPEPALAA